MSHKEFSAKNLNDCSGSQWHKSQILFHRRLAVALIKFDIFRRRLQAPQYRGSILHEQLCCLCGKCIDGCSQLVIHFGVTSKKNQNLHYTRVITPKRVTSGGVDPRVSAREHSSEDMSQRWRAVGTPCRSERRGNGIPNLPHR